LYFDGHDRPDVLAYRQNVFLPAMKAYEYRLIRYVVGDLDQEIKHPLRNCVERRLVLVPHDEMTSQANDAPEKAWVLEDQHRLRKKGVGQGLHKSDTICSTVGWLEEASQTLEYGKNYEGYWMGELFVKQVIYFAMGHWRSLVARFLINLFARSKRKSSQPLRRRMEPAIRLSLWSTIHRVTQHTPKMHW